MAKKDPPWSARELDLLLHYQHCLSIGDALLKQIGRSHAAIIVQLRRLHHPTPTYPRKFWTTSELRFLTAHADAPLDWLVDQLNRSKESIVNRLAKLEKAP